MNENQYRKFCVVNSLDYELESNRIFYENVDQKRLTKEEIKVLKKNGIVIMHRDKFDCCFDNRGNKLEILTLCRYQ